MSKSVAMSAPKFPDYHSLPVFEDNYLPCKENTCPGELVTWNSLESTNWKASKLNHNNLDDQKTDKMLEKNNFFFKELIC